MTTTSKDKQAIAVLVITFIAVFTGIARFNHDSNPTKADTNITKIPSSLDAQIPSGRMYMGYELQPASIGFPQGGTGE